MPADTVAGRKPPLLVFSPLPPMPTGIGDYSYDLLPALAPFHDIIVVVEDAAPPPRIPPGCAVTRLADYTRDAAAHAGTPHLYMLGNNPDHVYLLPVLAERPGVVVLHDPGLHHLLDCATAALGDVEAYIAAIEAEFGPPGRLLAEQWRAHELRDAGMVQGMPMLAHLLGPSRQVVVHSRSAALKVMAAAPDAAITIAPHPYIPPPVPDGAAIRARFGIGANTIVFLSLGFVSTIKRVDTALRAIARLAPELPDFRYIVAGAVRVEEVDVLGLAGRLGIADRVISTGYLPDGALHDFIAAADIVINLRHPVGGETSGTLIRALGDGACVVVTDDGPFSELPDDAVVKLRWSPAIELDLAAALLRLARHPAERRAVGQAAGRAIGTANAIGRTVAAYRAALARAAARRPPPWRSTAAHHYATPQRLAPAAEASLWQLLDAVPRLVPAGAVLALASDADLRGLASLGHAPIRAAHSWRPAEATARAYDLVFLRLGPGSALLTHPDLLDALNRITRFDGLLVLAIDGVPARAHSLAAHAPGAAALAAAGWHIELAEGAPPITLAAPPKPAADAVVWRARKISEPFRPQAVPAS